MNEISVCACSQANLWGPCEGLVPRLGLSLLLATQDVTELSKMSNVFLVTHTPPPSGFIACSLILHAAKLGVWVASLSPGNEARGKARWGLVFWAQAGVRKNGWLEEECVTM